MLTYAPTPYQYLFGLADGPFLTGVLSDAIGLSAATTAIPALGVDATTFLLLPSRTHGADGQRVAAVPIASEPGVEPCAGRPQGSDLIRLPRRWLAATPYCSRCQRANALAAEKD